MREDNPYYEENPMSRGCSEKAIHENIAMEYKRLRRQRPRSVPDRDVSKQAFAVAMNHARKMGCKRPMGYRDNPARMEHDVYGLASHGIIVAAHHEYGAIFVWSEGRLALWLESSEGTYIQEEVREGYSLLEAQRSARQWYEHLAREFGGGQEPEDPPHYEY
jgi:hypothetical protein